MANNPGTILRRRSMTDAAFFFRNPGATDEARSDLISSMVEEIRQRNAHIDEFATSLPKLNEKDLETLGQSDSVCPICLTSLHAILAEEETAIAMESPAHPIEELGVTRLSQTCGHIFCRKDIRGWLYEGHTTCPTCRTPFIAPRPGDSTAGGGRDFQIPADASFDALFDSEIARAFETFVRAPNRPGGAANLPTRNDRPESPDEELHEVQFEYNHDRDEFSGMYS